MTRFSPHHRHGAGFTLIEILVVAALIALLSGIAIISVQSFMARSQIRVVIGETYQLATAMSFARDDIGFYPKLSFLLLNVNEIGSDLGEIDITGNVINPDFELFGNAVASQTTRLITQWEGPYMGMSGSRNGVGGPSVLTMQLPIAQALGAEIQTARFPGDAWKQPYAVYMMNLDENGDISFLNDPTEYADVPNFFSAIVSYGPNQVPGGEEQPINQSTGAAVLPVDLTARIPARLYLTINGGAVDNGSRESRDRTYRALTPADYNTTDRLNGYHALVDPSSDDLVKEF